MATSLKFYLKKDYNQLRNRIIAQNTITFTFCDYTPAEGETVYFAIKEQNDVDEDETYLRMRKKDDNEFSIDLPCNKNEVFEFRIFTKFENSDEIIEQSAINTFKFEGIIFDEEKIENTAQWGTIQNMIYRLTEAEVSLETAVLDRIQSSDIVGLQVKEFLSNSQAELDSMKENINTVISQLSTILDEFIDDNEGDI